MQRLFGGLSCAGVALALGFLAANAAQAADPKPVPAKTASQAYDPHDLTGMWALVDGPFRTAEAFGRMAKQINPTVTLPHTDPKDYPNNHPPLPIRYTPEFEAIHKKMQADLDAGHPYRTGYMCQPNGIWSMMTNGGPLQIFRNGDRFLFQRENVGMLYTVYLGREHRKEFALPELFGDSVGKWEGDTLVVDSINLGAHMVLNETEPHTQALRIVQKITRPTFDTLTDELTAYDPRAFAVPFTVTLHWKLTPKAEFDENECANDGGGAPMAYAPE